MAQTRPFQIARTGGPSGPPSASAARQFDLPLDVECQRRVRVAERLLHRRGILAAGEDEPEIAATFGSGSRSSSAFAVMRMSSTPSTASSLVHTLHTAIHTSPGNRNHHHTRRLPRRGASRMMSSPNACRSSTSSRGTRGRADHRTARRERTGHQSDEPRPRARRRPWYSHGIRRELGRGAGPSAARRDRDLVHDGLSHGMRRA